MKAFVVEHYGKDGLRAADVPEPEVGGLLLTPAVDGLELGAQ